MRFPTHLIRQRDVDIRAWAHLEPQAPSAAGPLSGIPFGIKDIFDVVGMPTRNGSAIFDQSPAAAQDSGLVRMLREKGAIIVGKTHTTSFAYFDSAPTRNPHNLAHTPGGSSSGSAAAVACRMVPFATGSQTQGSVIRPASFCGVVGLKPTHGLLPLDGCMPFAPTLDTAGFFSTDAASMRWLWEALGYSTHRTGPLRIAAFRVVDPVEPAMQEAFERTVAKLGVKTIEPPAAYAQLYPTVRLLQDTEGGRTLCATYEEHGEQVGTKLAEMIRRGLATTEEAYQAALEQLGRMRAEFDELFRSWDVILTPAALGPAPTGFNGTGDPRMNSPWTGLGTPALCVPMPVAPGQLPLGLQLTSARHREADVLAAGALIEKAL